MCLLLYDGAPIESLPTAIKIKETGAKAKKFKNKDIRTVYYKLLQGSATRREKKMNGGK